MRITKTKERIGADRAHGKPAFGLAGVICALCLATASCGSGSAESVDGTPAVSDPVDTTSAGSVSLALDVGDAHLSSVSYTIIGGQFHQSGTLDVSQSTRISATIGGIPFGNDYVVTLSAASTEAVPTTCDGSAAFQVPNDVPVNVPVHVTCTQQNVLAATTPAPMPHGAGALLGLAMLGLGLAVQRRRAS